MMSHVNHPPSRHPHSISPSLPHPHTILIPFSPHPHPIFTPSSPHPHPISTPSSPHPDPIFTPSSPHLHPILPSSLHSPLLGRNGLPRSPKWAFLGLSTPLHCPGLCPCEDLSSFPCDPGGLISFLSLRMHGRD